MGARSRNFIPSSLNSFIESERQVNPSVTDTLQALGHRPRKRFSQSFLSDQHIADAIVRAAKLTGSETVLEIGPGLGVLTQRLVTRAARVVAVEIDRDLAARLPSAIGASNLEVVQMDALDLDPATLGIGEYRLVANLPYHVTSPILMRFLHDVAPPDLAVLMMQREVAERIAAEPGHLSYLSIAIQSAAAVQVVRQVPPTAFVPRPKVDSTVLRLVPHRVEPGGATPGAFLPFVRAGFTQPRKRLANSLSQGLNIAKSTLDTFLEEQDIGEQCRPHELSIEQWQCLSAAWHAQADATGESTPAQHRRKR
ncbi:MAG: 16S rRNA (adenine(1518)-N(6)/adenine(1519)-N(6))-dimethyltransferase RsmA [Chloroflexota bacterium]